MKSSTYASIATPLLLAMGADLTSQTHWLSVPSGTYPSQGSGTLFYDSVRGLFVTIGSDATNSTVVFELVAQAWQQAPGVGPTFVGGGNACYDPTRLAIVVTGGFNPVETWLWQGDTQVWSLVTIQGPAFFQYAPMVFHSRRGTVMQFGGLSGLPGTPTNQLWELVGSTWAQIPDPNPPPDGFEYGTLAYDSLRDKLVVYGAGNGNQPMWEWDSTSGWLPGGPTGPQFQGSMLVYDEARSTLVVVGYHSFGTFETWERRSGSTTWTFRGSAPGISRWFVYDSNHQRSVILGSPALRAYAPVSPASWSPLGAGCGSSIGPPVQSLAHPSTRAWLGDTLQVTIQNLPTSSAIQVLGFSSTSSGGLPLPADLTAYGAPGCHLRVAVDSYSVLLGSNNQCTFTAGVPNASTLIGLPYFLQAVVPDPAWNSAGLVLSEAIAGTIGSR